MTKTPAQLDREIASALVAEKHVRAVIEPPQRVEILKSREDYRWKWKPGQFAYAVSYTTQPGMPTVNKGFSTAGDLVYGVAKNRDLSTGVYFFSEDALRFTRVPRDLIAALSDDEKVALDLIADGRDGIALSSLVADSERRAYIRAIAAQLRSLRARKIRDPRT